MRLKLDQKVENKFTKSGLKLDSLNIKTDKNYISQ